MGINELWDVLRPAFDERVTIEKFTVVFVEKYGRTPRLAIDASHFMFSNSNVHELDRTTSIVRNFMAKIFKLISLNLSVIVVFDGFFKPNKLRNGTSNELIQSYEDELLRFESATPEEYEDCSFLEVPLIKELLVKNRIDYLQAAGEAEAQCAQLQMFGIVDFIITNDSDAFVFGCTKVLRNFNKVKEDLLFSPKKNPVANSKDYYVTPVRMSEIEERMGLTWERFILIASLRGGDYSKGLQRIGITHALNLALCDTKFRESNIRSPSKAARKLEEESMPNLSKLFLESFVKHNLSGKFGKYSLIADPDIRREKLRQFLILLNETIRKSSRYIFGRLLTFTTDFDIDEYYTMLYLAPIVEKRIYKFIPQSLGFGELNSIDNDLSFSNINIYEGEHRTLWRVNSTLTGKLEVIGISNISNKAFPGSDLRVFNQSFEPKGDIISNTAEYFIPTEFTSNPKLLILKLATRYKIFDDLLMIDRGKFDDDLGELLRVKYDESKLSDFISSSSSSLEVESDSKSMSSVWLLKILLQLVSKSSVEEFLLKEKENQEKKAKKSPKKLKEQKSKIDLYFQKVPKLQGSESNLTQISNSSSSSDKSFRVPSPKASDTEDDPFTDHKSPPKTQFLLSTIIKNKPNLSLPATSSKRRPETEHTSSSPTKKSNVSNGQIQVDKKSPMPESFENLSLVEIEDDSTIIEITEAEFKSDRKAINDYVLLD
ncbi:hypothetical protein DFJ63DRAFT_315532 [Scheffersomyces coipomensis]|uniref:uncharacterized protein n=1 Tax=Scheffersomyces coipomensis TaxID=1788519 RepID=UPI00315DB077